MEFGHVGTHQQNNLTYDITNIDEVEQCKDDSTLEASIKIMLRQQSPDFSKWCIYRVPKRLLSLDCKAYRPEVISIGPFHHGQKDLMGTEQLKLVCLNSYLHRINMSVEDVVAKARNWESKARSCYAEHINMNSDDFVKMLLMDGCFIVEALIIASNKHFDIQNEFDLSFFRTIWFDLGRDLMMLENQLPFFVLESIFVLEKDKKYVLHYIQFLQGLIGTEEDVALLVKEEILINLPRAINKEVSKLFNNLCKYTPIPQDFYYYGTSKDLYAYCRKWRHRSMATLRRDYFYSPWACISFVAATFLILLTFLQTIFSSLSISSK